MTRKEKILSYALWLLQGKSYSTQEIHTKLFGKYEEKDLIEEVLSDLVRTKVLDDAEYARNYIRYRTELAPRGKRMLLFELKKKGVDAEEFLEDFDEEEVILPLAERKLRNFPSELEKQKKKEKLFRFLVSRGFEPAKIFSVVDRCLSACYTDEENLDI